MDLHSVNVNALKKLMFFRLTHQGGIWSAFAASLGFGASHSVSIVSFEGSETVASEIGWYLRTNTAPVWPFLSAVFTVSKGFLP